MTTYQIVRIIPTYHYSTDALIGYSADPLPMAYFSEALANKLAGRMQDADYNACGDDSFRVVEYGASAFHLSASNRFIPNDRDAFSDMPF